MLFAIVPVLCVALLLCWLYRRLIANHHALEQQTRLLAEHAQLLDLANDAILVWELGTGSISFWNRGAEALYGWTRAEVAGRTPQAILRTTFPQPLAEINAELVRDQRWEGELVHTCREGRVVTVASRWALRLDAVGKPTAVLGINTDITARKEFEAKLQHQALHDPLTGLPNRVLFRDRLEQALAQANRHESQIAVLFLDLDGFKKINDRMGHHAGDALLIDVARRLRACLRAGDTVARLGGDEFICLLGDLTQPAEVAAVADRIESALVAPIHVEDDEVLVSASIGLAVSHRESTPDALLREADRTMYAAKQHRFSVAAAVTERPVRQGPGRTSLVLPTGSA